MSPTQAPASDVLDVPALAAILGCSHRRVYELAGRDVPGWKVGRAWRFDRRDVDAFLKRQKQLEASRPRGRRGPRART